MCKAARSLRSFVSLLLVAGILTSAPKLAADDSVAGQVVVQIDWGFPIEPLIVDFNGVSLDTIIDINTFLVGFPDSIPVDTIIGLLLPRPGVLQVQPNFIFGIPEVNQISQSFPDQQQPVFLRGESPPSYYGQPGTYSVGLDSAQMLASGTGVVVAVIDNGLDFAHPLFEGALADTGYDFVEDDSDPSEQMGDMYGHGTFVSGLILLAAPDSKIIPLRAFDENGLGTSFAAAKAISWAVDNGADVINMSFGLYLPDPVMEAAVNDAAQHGIVMVASVGNDSTSAALYPAAYSSVVAVSAIDTLELAAGFSNYGDYVDVCAPGVNVYSSLAGEYDWGTWSGTSFSAPFISGICALVLESKPDIEPDDVYETIRQTARTDLDWGTVTPPDPHYGYGCADAFEAVMAWSRGDVDNSGQINIGDLTYLVDFLFKSGPTPEVSLLTGDFTCDGDVNIADVSGIAGYLFHAEGGFWPCY